MLLSVRREWKRRWRFKFTKLHDDLAKVVWVPRPGEEADIAHLPFVLRLAPKDVFLNIRYAFEEESEGEEHDACNISASVKRRLVELGDVGRVEDCDG